MAINQNHLFEELDGVKCAIVEKNASPERVAFLQSLLAFNHYTVVVVPSPPPKAAPAPIAKPAPATAPDPSTAPTTPALAANPASLLPAAPDTTPASAASPPAPATAAPPPPPPPPSTFTIGVTDVTFNPTNAIFGRLLHTPDGHTVTLAYWQQKEKISNDEIPYFDAGK
jgi:hypothetical protein